jgi:hypothetical protein
MKVTKLIHHYGNFIATADVDGVFDKCGLPDPLVLAFYFTPPQQSDCTADHSSKSIRHLTVGYQPAAVISNDRTPFRLDASPCEHDLTNGD